MLDLSAHLGFYPSKDSFDLPYFNLSEGCFVDKNLDERNTLNKNKTSILKSLMNNSDCSIVQNKKAEILLFISAAPLAVITFSLISAANGSQDHDSTGPVGTTSV